MTTDENAQGLHRDKAAAADSSSNGQVIDPLASQPATVELTSAPAAAADRITGRRTSIENRVGQPLREKRKVGRQVPLVNRSSFVASSALPPLLLVSGRIPVLFDDKPH